MFDDRYTLAYKRYPYKKSADQDKAEAVRHPIVVVGGGPIGVAAALDFGQQGIPVLVLDDHEGVGMGSRAICFSKRCLEVADRYGCGEPMVKKGITWNLGKVFHRDELIYEFNLLPEEGHKYPAFINMQQPYYESFQLDRLEALQAQGAPIQLRGKNRVDAVDVHDDHVILDVMTPDGPYKVEADWLVVCDGANSPLRDMMGLGFTGKVFEDNFLIADIKMKGEVDFPIERRFWFEPGHGEGASMLLHKQPDDVWRVDFQIGWDVDRKEEMKEENIRRRLDAFLGGIEYELVWTSIYTFQCKRMESFRHGHVFFAGDAAHQVSPFGARGANSGIQDIDNLGWKLGLVIHGKAPEALLDTYSAERVHGADENLLNSTRSTDFITPKSEISKIFRDAVLALSDDHDFARPFVNSGRLSVPCTYDGLPLNGVDDLPGGPARTRPGSVCADVPMGDRFLLDILGSRGAVKFQILAIDTDVPDGFSAHGIETEVLRLSTADAPLLAERYLGDAKSAVYLIRPDQHVAARWESWNETAVADALGRAIGQNL